MPTSAWARLRLRHQPRSSPSPTTSRAASGLGSVVALVLFGISAILAVLAERTTALPDAPDILDLANLVNQPDSNWSDDQIAFWVAREYVERIQPLAERELRSTARLVSAQMFLFLGEVAVVGGTLTVALAY